MGAHPIPEFDPKQKAAAESAYRRGCHHGAATMFDMFCEDDPAAAAMVQVFGDLRYDPRHLVAYLDAARAQFVRTTPPGSPPPIVRWLLERPVGQLPDPLPGSKAAEVELAARPRAAVWSAKMPQRDGHYRMRWASGECSVGFVHTRNGLRYARFIGVDGEHPESDLGRGAPSEGFDATDIGSGGLSCLLPVEWGTAIRER